MSIFLWVTFFSILIVAIAGGYYPLFRSKQARSAKGFPEGEAFSSGVFLALGLIIMLPTAAHLFKKVFSSIEYPLAFSLSIIAFLFLLAMEHAAEHAEMEDGTPEGSGDVRVSCALFPVIMTVMIAIPSFLLGTALGVSGSTLSAVFIFIAVLAHKGSAGFGLALSMVRSTLTRRQIFLIYGIFVVSTPMGILVGADIRHLLGNETMVIVKAVILSLASGVFLYMSTLHGLKFAPMICCSRKGFRWMLAGLVITALVRLALGYAHGG